MHSKISSTVSLRSHLLWNVTHCESLRSNREVVNNPVLAEVEGNQSAFMVLRPSRLSLAMLSKAKANHSLSEVEKNELDEKDLIRKSRSS